MNRRQALRNIGLGAGVMIVGPSTLSLLQSCKNEPSYDWQPTFLSAANGFALKQVMEVILPTTETPGAGDLNLAMFIDSYMNEVASEERQKEFKAGAENFVAAFKDKFDKEPGEGTTEEYEQIVSNYLSYRPENSEEQVKRNTETQDPMDKDPGDKVDFDSGAQAYLNNIREMGIWAWKTSEQIGENVLWYDPIPGQYIACGPIDELSNGRAMSL